MHAHRHDHCSCGCGEHHRHLPVARLLVESAAEEAQTRRAPGSQIRGRVRMVPVTG